MPTPSSGTICWSQIQAETGGSYCMSNFNAVSGRGYCASDYYNYPPPTLCTYYQTYDYGYVLYYDCAGNSQYYYVGPSEYLCVSSFDGGPAFDTTVPCT